VPALKSDGPDEGAVLPPNAKGCEAPAPPIFPMPPPALNAVGAVLLLPPNNPPVVFDCAVLLAKGLLEFGEPKAGPAPTPKPPPNPPPTPAVGAPKGLEPIPDAVGAFAAPKGLPPPPIVFPPTPPKANG